MFRKKFRRILSVAAIRRSLKKKAPRRMPYASKNDYYVCHVKSADGREILVESIDDKKLSGKLWRNQEFSDEIEVDLSDFLDWSLDVTRFYGYVRVDYVGAGSFWIGESLFKPQRIWILEAITQRIYNAQFRFRDDRIEVLRKLAAIEIESAQQGNAFLHEPSSKSIIQIATSFFGQRYFAYPRRNEVDARFRLLIESLAASGDLEKTNKHEFRFQPQALATLAAYEQDERRHMDSVRLNRWLVILTAVLALTALFSWFDPFN